MKWLERDANTTLVRKDCINGFVRVIGPDERDAVVDLVNTNQIVDLLFSGICTDICVMDFVLTTLSARNHGMIPNCEEIYV